MTLGFTESPKADNLTAICDRLSRKCGSLDASQPYGPPQPVTETASFLLTFYKIDSVRFVFRVKYNSHRTDTD
jgi:hypothetical protein